MAGLSDFVEGAISVGFVAVADFLFNILSHADVAMDLEVLFYLTTSTDSVSGHRCSLSVGDLVGDDVLFWKLSL